MTDYISTKKLNLDLQEIKKSCEEIYKIVLSNFDHAERSYQGRSTETTQLFNNYNLLMYPFPQFWNLYQEIKTMFREISKDTDQCYIQCWLNYYQKGDYIDWHDHWSPEAKSYHGFFCVDTEPSKTTYRIPNVVGEVDVESKDNLLVMSRSNGDLHRTWEWPYDRPRITIAFDIVPSVSIDPLESLNHWIPI